MLSLKEIWLNLIRNEKGCAKKKMTRESFKGKKK